MAAALVAAPVQDSSQLRVVRLFMAEEQPLAAPVTRLAGRGEALWLPWIFLVLLGAALRLRGLFANLQPPEPLEAFAAAQPAPNRGHARGQSQPAAPASLRPPPARLTPPTEKSHTMQCPNCGQANRADSRFCQRCGATLAGAAPAAIPAGRPAGSPPPAAPLPAPPPAIGQLGTGGTAAGNIWTPFAGYGTRGRHVSWLLDNLGHQAGDLHTAVTDRFQQRAAVSYTPLRAHETVLDLVCRLLLEKKKHSHTSALSPYPFHIKHNPT